MKLKNLETMGHCGVQVTLNLMDQYELTHTVERYDELQKRLEAYRAYQALSYHEQEELRKNKVERPVAPKIDELEDITNLVMIFLRKLCFNGGDKATMFEEEPRINPETGEVIR